MENRTHNRVILVATTLLLSAPAYANVGAPPMMPGLAALLFGNAIIGTVEGLLATWLAGIPKRFSIPLMILANYVSAYIGIISCKFGNPSNIPQIDPGISLPSILRVIIIAFIALYIATFVIEYLFLRIAMISSINKPKRPWRETLRVCLIINLVSYAGLVLLFLTQSDISVLTKTHYDASASFLSSRTGHIYYYKPNKGIYRIPLNGKGEESFVAPGEMIGRQIFAFKSTTANGYDLCTFKPNETGTKVLVPNFSCLTIPYWVMENGKLAHRSVSPSSSSPFMVDFRNGDNPKYRVWSNRSEYRGMFISGPNRRDVILGLYTPFAGAKSGYGAILSGEILIYELGGRIMALDLNNMHIAQLAIGECPVVTLD